MNAKNLLPITALLVMCGCSNNHEVYNTRRIKSVKVVETIESNENLNGQIHLNESAKDLMLEYLNEVRRQGSQCSGPVEQPLSWNRVLEHSSSSHAEDLAVNHILSHDGSGTSLDIASTTPGVGSKFYERILISGYKARPHMKLGETLGIIKTNITGDDNLIHNFKREVGKFLNSPEHCSIVMNPRFDYVGIGAYKIKNSYYFVFDFGEKP